MVDIVANPFDNGAVAAAPSPDAGYNAKLQAEANLSGVPAPVTAQHVQASVSQAVATDPDYEASLRAEAAKANIPIVAAREFPNETKQQASLSGFDYSAIAAASPATAKQLANFSTAQIAHDDVPNMQATERTLGQLGMDTLAALGQGSTGLAQAADTLNNVTNPNIQLVDFIASRLGYGMPMQNLHAATQSTLGENQATLQSMKSPYLQQQDAAVTNAKGFGDTLDALLSHPASIVDTGTQMLPQLGAVGKGMQLAMVGKVGAAAIKAAIVGNVATNAAIGGGSAGSQAYQAINTMPQAQLETLPAYKALVAGGTAPDDARAQLSSHAETVATAIAAPLSGVISRIGAGVNAKFLNQVIGNKAIDITMGQAAKAIVPTIAKEATENALNMSIGMQLPTNIGAATVNPNQDITEGVGNAAATGGLIGFGMGLAPASSNLIAAHFSKVQAAQAAVAKESALQDLNALSQTSKLNQRDANTHAAFIDDAAKNGASTVYIDANTLQQSGLADKLAEVSPSVAEQLPIAQATGGDIVIPMGEYASKIAPVDTENALVEHLKTNPEDMTAAEGRAYLQTHMDDLQNQVEQSLAAHQGDESFKASADAVKAKVLDQLNQSNRFTPKANEAYSSLVSAYYATNAAKLGMMPEQLHTNMPMHVVAEDLLGGNRLDQRTPWNPDFPDATVLHKLGDVTSNPDHDAAKAGDSQAALRLIDSTVTPEDTQKVKDAYQGKADYVVPVHAVEGAGLNKIPLAYAHKIGSDLGIPVHDGIVQDSVVKRSASDGVGRLTKEVAFHGDVIPGKKYLLADDTLTQGGTLAGLKGYIESHGGEVIGASALMGKQYSAKLAPDAHTLAALRDAATPEFEKWWEHEYGHSFDQLTESEARYLTTLIRKSDVDSVRTRLLASGSKGSERSDAQALRSEEDTLKQGARGSFHPDTNTIALLKDADLSTFLHETGHFFFENNVKLATDLHLKPDLADGEKAHLADTSATLSWLGIKGDIGQQLAQWHTMPFEEKRAYHEQTAESFEHYLMGGKAPSIELQHVFQTFRNWLLNVYKSLKSFIDGHPDAGKLSDEVRGVFDRMLATNDQIALAEQGRSMMPLFATPEEAGMTPAEFAQYHALGVQATLDAQQDLSARGIRDMQWLENKQLKMIKALQKEHTALRAEAQIDVRRQVMSQPVYQAWQFLTGRIRPEDKLLPHSRGKSDPNTVDYTQDSLFTAIAKLGGINKEDAVKTWGVDPKEKLKNPVFGKPVLRKEGGRSIGALEEVLLEHGYLMPDEHGKARTHELAELFDRELRGEPVYSEWVDHSKLTDEQRTAERYNLSALTAGRLDLTDVKNMHLPAHIEQALSDRKMTAKTGGMHPDLVADQFGFNSGDDMVRQLAVATPPKEEIEGLTDAKMLEEHGEIATPDRLAAAADKAIHNDVRSRFIAAEANALNKATGNRKILISAAKAFASEMIARLKISDIKPNLYLTAETRAGKAADVARKAGDLKQAATEKRNQLINNLAAKAATEAHTEVAKTVAYLKKFDNPRYVKKIETEAHYQIFDLLSKFDFRKVVPDEPRRDQVNLQTWHDSQIEAGYAPAIDPALLSSAAGKHFKDMTLAELRGLSDTVASIEHIGREMNQLMIAGERTDLNDFVRNELVPKMKERGEQFSAEQIIDKPEERFTNPFMIALAHMGSWLRSARSQLKPQEFKRNQYDMHEILGPFGQAIFEPVFDANYHKIDMLKGLSDDFAAKGAELGKEWQDHILDTVPNNVLIDPDKTRITGQTVFMKINRSKLLGIALHVGNESNFDKLTRGWNWDPATVWGFLHDNMSKKDWDAVQTVGDLYEKHWPEIEQMNKRLGNSSPDKVVPRPFNTAFGEMKGWYAAIRYDRAPERSRLGEKESAASEMNPTKNLFGPSYFRADSTTNGSLNSRNAGYTDRVDLDFHHIATTMNESIHDLAYREALIDVHKILKQKDFRLQFRLTYGNEAYNGLLHWVGNIANSAAVDQSVSALSRFLSYTRTGLVINAIGFRASTVLKHGGSAGIKSTGYFPGASKMLFAKRMAAIGTNYSAEIQGAVEKFPEIRARLMQQDRDYRVLQASMLEPESVMGKAHRFGHAAVAWADMVTAVPTAWAAYDRAITTGIPVKEGGTGHPMSEEDAVQYASKIVREAHGSNIESARSLTMNTNSESVKMFTVLYGFMNNTYGQVSDIADKVRTSGLGHPAVLGRTFAALLVPALWAGYLNDGSPDHDKHGFVHWISKAIMGEIAGMVPVVRDGYSMFEEHRGAGLVAAESWLAMMVKPIVDVAKMAEGKPPKAPIKDFADAAGAGLHIPGLGQAGATAQYYSDISTGAQPKPANTKEFIEGTMKGHVHKDK